MKKLTFTPVAAMLIGLVFLGNTTKTAAQSAGDGSVPAITAASAKLPLEK